MNIEAAKKLVYSWGKNRHLYAYDISDVLDALATPEYPAQTTIAAKNLVVLPPKDVLCDMLGELRAKGYSWEEIAQAVIDDIYRLNPQIKRGE